MKNKIIRSKFSVGHNLYEVIVWMNKHKSVYSKKCLIKNLMWEDTDMDKHTYEEITRILGVELTEKDIYDFEPYLFKILLW